MEQVEDINKIGDAKINLNEEEENESHSKKAASFCQLQYAMSKRFDIFVVCIAIIGSLGMGVSMPLFAVIFGGTINTLGGGTKIDPNQFIENIRQLCLKFLYVGLGIWAAAFLMMWLWSYNGRTMAKRIKKQYFKLLMKQEQGYFDGVKPFEFATKVQTQVKTIELGLGDKIGQTLMAFSMTISSFIVGFTYSWKLSLVLMSFLPLMLVGSYIMIVNIRTSSVKNRKAYEQAGGIAEEVIYQIKTVSSFSNYDFEIARFNEKLEVSLKAGLSGAVKSGLTMGFLFFIIFASYTLAIWFGSKLIADKEYNSNTGQDFRAGDVLTVLFTIVFGAFSLGQAAPNIKAITEAMNAAYDFFELKKRVPEMMNRGEEKPDKDKILGQIEFREVSFAYKKKPEKIILNKVNITMEAGKTMAIVGRSGMGKSTIINLVERLYDTTGGHIFMDTFDITSLDLKYYRSLIGYVPQEPVLFNTSIRDNIIFGREDISDEQVWAACKKAYADEFIRKMDEGLDYIVGIKGGKLSGGQKQRIAIARAILTQPKILILDEATSALDNKSEKEVQKALNKVSQGLTTIIIAHRLSTIIHADKIIVISDGHIVEEGNHKSLMEREGVYAGLVRTQVGIVDNTDEEERENNNVENINDINNPVPITTRNAVELENLNDEIPRSKVQRKSSFEELQDKIEAEKEKKKEFEKMADEKRKKIWPILGQFKGTIIFAAFFGSCAGAVWPAYGILLADSISALSQQDLNKVRHDGFLLSMYFLALAGGAGISVFLQNYLFTAIGEYLTRSLRSQTFVKYLRMDMGFYDVPSHTPGNLTTQLSSDTTKTNSVALSMVGVSVQTTATLLVAIILGFIFDWRLSLINMGFLPLIMLSSVFHFKMQQGFSSVDEVVEAAAGGVVSESVCNTKTIFSYNMQDRVVRMYKKILKNGFKTINKSSFVNGILFGFSQMVMFATYSAIFYAGGSFMYQGTLDLDHMMRAIFVLLFAGFGVGQAQQYVGDMASAKAALVNIFKTLDESSLIDPIEIRDRSDPPALRPEKILGKVEFKDVSFAYPTRPDVVIFENLNLTILPGQRAAFVGHSGSGKSTIIQLLLRFYDVTSGQILIDDKDIKEYDLITLRSFISLVMQEPILFKTDVIENIRYGKLDANYEEVEKAANVAKIGHFLTPENKGKILEISGGEKQRIAIARAIIKNPVLLLLDEATSALDGNVEKEIQQCLEELMPGRTSVTIAHKLVTVVNSDVIFVMDGGKIHEQGTHNELMELKGRYYHLYSAGQAEVQKQ